MKKIVILVCCLLAAAGTIIFLVISHSQKYNKFSGSEIIFSLPESVQPFRSGTKASTNLPNEYQIIISNNLNLPFENPILTSSTNVQKSVTFDNQLIYVVFSLTSGTTFSFELSCANFQTVQKTFGAKPYVQKDEIVLQVATNPNGAFENYSNQNNKIYLVEEALQATALNDGFASSLFIRANCATAEDELLALHVAPSGHLQLLPTANPRIKQLCFKSLGTSTVTVLANDGSEAKREFDFSVEQVPAISVAIDSQPIVIDLAVSANTPLPTPVIFPSYARAYSLTFESSAPDIFGVENLRIIPHQTGTGSISAVFNGNVIATIPVTITQSSQPYIQFVMNDAPLNTTQTATQDLQTFCVLRSNLPPEWAAFATFNFDVCLQNHHTQTDFTFQISDPSLAVLEGKFITGGTNRIFTLSVLNQPCEVLITFSTQITNATISKTLKIILE